MNNFFILGCPRSGTTMLQQALNRHSRILIPPETKFFFSLLGRSRRQQQRHLERLRNDLGIELPGLRRRVKSVQEAREFFECMARRYRERVGKQDCTWFGEKTPEHTGQLRRIREVFPEAKVIFLYRDGRDVALSLTRVPWMHKSIYVNFTIWRYYQRVLAKAREDESLDALFVKYEELAARPAEEAERILAFLGLEYEPAVAEGHGNREGIPPREYPWKGRALEPITTGRIGLWRKELAECEVAALERMGRRELDALGYELATGGNRRLSPLFYARLGWDLMWLAARLPWGPLASDLCEQARLGLAAAGNVADARCERGAAAQSLSITQAAKIAG